LLITMLSLSCCQCLHCFRFRKVVFLQQLVYDCHTHFYSLMSQQSGNLIRLQMSPPECFIHR
jgi:hypothetical protein